VPLRCDHGAGREDADGGPPAACERSETKKFIKIVFATGQLFGATLPVIKCDEMVPGLLDIMCEGAPCHDQARHAHHPMVCEMIPYMLDRL
jgi:hypothetical protein